MLERESDGVGNAVAQRQSIIILISISVFFGVAEQLDVELVVRVALAEQRCVGVGAVCVAASNPDAVSINFELNNGVTVGELVRFNERRRVSECCRVGSRVDQPSRHARSGSLSSSDCERALHAPARHDGARGRVCADFVERVLVGEPERVPER